MNNISKKWMDVIRSGMESNKGRRTDGPGFKACATEVDTIKYLSEFWDSRGFVREQILGTK
jgi:hypothetical protein